MSKQDKSAEQPVWQSYRRLLGYVKTYWMMFAVSIFGFVIYAGTQTAAAKWLEFFVDTIEKGELEKRGWLALAVIAIFFCRGIGTFLGNYGLAYVARYTVHHLRIDLFNQLQVLPCSFYDKYSSGELLSRLTYNVEQVTGAATDALKVAIREGLTVIGLFGYMLYLNWKLTLLFLVVGPVVGGVVGLASKRLRRLSHGIQNSVGDITNAASEAIKGHQVVRIFGGTEFEKQRFHKASERNRHQFMKMVVTQSIMTPVVQMLVASVIAILTFLAMTPSLMSQMSTGEFIAFISAASLLAKPVRQLTEVNSIIQKGIAAAQSLFELIDEPVEPDAGIKKVERVAGDISIKQLNYRYPGAEHDVISDLSLDIKAGQTVALVGRSGSGKSTLANLLPQFYNCGDDSIKLDGVSLQDYQLESLRHQIALVNQKVVLFNGTIAENIAYGTLSNCTREEVMAAAEAAHVTEFLDRLPEGLDTMVGEDGILLSGGQRQRIAIARAILKDAPVLILDEATSALDTESERHIQAALDNVMQGRTTLVIAHRLSTIESADLIVVMDAGQIVEQGSHQQLLKLDGAYASLHRMQFNEHESRITEIRE